MGYVCPLMLELARLPSAERGGWGMRSGLRWCS